MTMFLLIGWLGLVAALVREHSFGSLVVVAGEAGMRLDLSKDTSATMVDVLCV